MPGQGTRSMFTIGFGYGLWLGILATLRLPYTAVRPGMWKRAMALGKDKEASRLRAQQLYPGADCGSRSIMAELRAFAGTLWAQAGTAITPLSWRFSAYEHNATPKAKSLMPCNRRKAWCPWQHSSYAATRKQFTTTASAIPRCRLPKRPHRTELVDTG